MEYRDYTMIFNDNLQVELDELYKLAQAVVNQPWGCGDIVLAGRHESSVPYNRFLHALVKRYQPEVALECGSYLGTASAHMATANRNTDVFSIDIDPRPELAALQLRYHNLRYVKGDSTSSGLFEFMAKLIGKRTVGLLFLDSAHDGATPQKEYELYSQLCDPAGFIVVCDDIIGEEHYSHLMKAFWKWLPGAKMALDFLHPMADGLKHTPGFGISLVCYA